MLERKFRTTAELRSVFQESVEYRNKNGSPRGNESEIYRGYENSDINLVSKYAVFTPSLEPDHLVDGFGHRILYNSVPWAKRFNLKHLRLPFPQDGFHAGAAEYVALVDSIERTTCDHCCIVELGAGWGPWISLGGLIAKRRNFDSLSLVGIEASPLFYKLMREQLAFNNLRPQGIEDEYTVEGNVKCRLVNGVVGNPEKYPWMWFPDVSPADMGAAASNEEVTQDYRGRQVKSIRTKCYGLQELFGDAPEITFLHMDIQGSEFDLVADNIDLIGDRVSGMMIATHSRVIEGRLVELLYSNGWRLHREKPCRVKWNSNAPTITGIPALDGCQYWRRKKKD